MKTKRGMGFYKSYSFKERDPVIGELKTIVRAEGANYAQVHRASGVSATTLSNWFGPKGKTKRPQNASIEAVGRSLGYRREWTHWKNVQLEKHKPNGHDKK